MSAQNKVHQLDRIVIAAIALLSLLSEGWLSDCLIMISMLLWLWLPEFEKLLLKFSSKSIKQ